VGGTGGSGSVGGVVVGCEVADLWTWKGSSSEGADTAAMAEERCSSEQQRHSERRNVLVKEIGHPSRAIAKLLSHLLKRLATNRGVKPSASGVLLAKLRINESGALRLSGPASRPLWPQRALEPLSRRLWQRLAPWQRCLITCDAVLRSPNAVTAPTLHRSRCQSTTAAQITIWAPAHTLSLVTLGLFALSGSFRFQRAAVISVLVAPSVRQHSFGRRANTLN
jgi:hypothetical protein